MPTLNNIIFLGVILQFEEIKTFLFLSLADRKETKISPCLHSSFTDHWKFGDKSFDVGLVCSGCKVKQ